MGARNRWDLVRSDSGVARECEEKMKEEEGVRRVNSHQRSSDTEGTEKAGVVREDEGDLEQ